ncbi:response regulator [Deinococcus yavapaiensis]|uniref:Response regulator receiver domain-containing protein n=1 Tax=Deinococcus yavapaiensis KR-236 TaxID=694435 RepID=A0A318SBK5_9DEIO|nr:response regulator [Deinococcus yavapaiensis]PYE54581.1 response regulator receiver domain-containing protein [Deinococcus yavapaiensis KR-236]
MSGKRILLVDDNHHDVELALAAFEEGNLRSAVVVAHSGEEALDYLYARGRFSGREGGHPTVILLDLKMPHMDGVAVLRAIKADTTLQGIPVVMLSTSREDGDIEACYRVGASAYVVKPVDFTQFIEAVKTIGVFWALLNEHPPGGARR